MKYRIENSINSPAMENTVRSSMQLAQAIKVYEELLQRGGTWEGKESYEEILERLVVLQQHIAINAVTVLDDEDDEG